MAASEAVDIEFIAPVGTSAVVDKMRISPHGGHRVWGFYVDYLQGCEGQAECG